MQITTQEIIDRRKREIFNDSQTIQTRLMELQLEVQELERKYAFLLAENDMLERIGDRAELFDTQKRDSSRRDRLMIEDAVRMIFENAGRPIKVSELIAQLETYGYQWSKYNTAYYHIKNMDFVQPTGKFGYVQFLRGGRY